MDPVLNPGDVLLGKYRVEKILGQGGMGVVAAARHIELGHLFAIKCLLPAAMANEDVVLRFLREARAAAGLHSEHVAHVVDVGRLENGVPYMVMEHLDGCDLRELVRSRGPLPVREAAAYVIQANEAISEAHAMGIVHRDIKPANLFLVKKPNGAPCVKVLDFGISKQLDPEGMALTKTGALVGSPLYMSPEQMLSSKDADVRSDVWSMGVVLYELCTGRIPFDGETVPEVAIRVVQEAPKKPSELRPDLPAELDAVVLRCLQKRPEDRYPSMNDLTEALLPLAGLSPAALAIPAGSDAPPPAAALSDGPSQTLQGASVSDSLASRPPKRRVAWIVSTAGMLLLGLGIAAGAAWISRSQGPGAAAIPGGGPASIAPVAETATALLPVRPADSAAPSGSAAATTIPTTTPTLVPVAPPLVTPGASALAPSAKPAAGAAPAAKGTSAKTGKNSPAAAPSASGAPPPATAKKPEGIF